MKTSLRSRKPLSGKQNNSRRTMRRIGAALLVVLMRSQNATAYPTYQDGCVNCHGDFRVASLSPKGTVFPSGSNHEMHRASANMATACNLCHRSTADRSNPMTYSSAGTTNNVGLGCSGCHAGPGLRKHHVINGVTECYDCHSDDFPPPETVKPPYYGTPDTKANNPGNTVLLAKTNENWSVGDFLGLDNDGNNLYDLADYAVGPYRLLNIALESNINVRVTWLTAGGRVDTVESDKALGGTSPNVTSDIAIPGIGLVTNTYVDVGGATNSVRFYKMSALVP